MKLVLVVGNDKIGRHCIQQLPQSKNVTILLDSCTDAGRVVTLLRKGSLPIRALISMTWANIIRKETKLEQPYSQLKSNTELLRFIDNDTTILLFRAGLIVSQDTIDKAKDIFNVHCASIPEFGGIASIYRAIKAEAFSQNATLHKVTIRIDEGEVVDVEPYLMSKSKNYFLNEETAYQAGLTLINRILIKYEKDAKIF